MKKSILTGMALCALLLPLTTGCSEESTQAGGDTGRLAPGVDFKSEPLTARGDSGNSRATADKTVTVDDLSLRLLALDRDYTNTWTPISTFDSSQEFASGRYKVEAFYGSQEDEGYGKPYYYGSQEITVLTDRTTPVSINVTLANSIIKVVYTDAFRQYMAAGYSAQLHSAGGAYFDYDEANPEELYVRPGEVSLDLNITKPNGKSGQFEAARFTAKPRYRHTITVDVNGGEVGSAESLKITFDETLDKEEVDIDISDDILSASAPTITPAGFTPGEEIEMVEGVTPADGLKMNIVARGKISTVTLTTASESLLSAGWPAEVDLANPDVAVKSKLMEMGLNTLGVWNRPDEMGVIDFTNAVAKIPFKEGGNNLSTFTVVVKDKNGKVCDPVSFSVNLQQLRLALTSGVISGAGQLNLTVDYNGADISKVEFKAVNSRNTLTPLTVKSATQGADGLYTVVVAQPDNDPVISPDDNITVRAYAGSLMSEIIVKAPAMNISAPTINAFAKSAYVPVNFTDAAVAAQSGNVELFISTDGLSYRKVQNPVAQSAPRSRAAEILKTVTYLIRGLEPSTNYWVLSRLGSEESVAATFTTEAATLLPNAGMENWYSESVYTSKTAWVGETDIVRWFANANGESFWATRNALTTAQSSGTTCYYTSFSGTVPVNGNSGKAAEISTLGYGEGSTYANSSGTIGENKHTAVGMLFIGNHSASGETSETIEYGKPFTSRPAGFSFKYKFAPINTESFKAYMVVENRNNGVVELGRGEIVSGTAQSNFTTATVNIDYKNKSLKATHIYIVFLSSTAESPAVKGVKGSKGTFNGFADSKRVGSVLTVDDIELIY
ncbi:MAG: DUF4493 domain-containing protein [Muribaculaceae bacterium]|nr:DUF4493 domain-containing protein [Muribaculaceae bacterium]